MVEIRDTTVGGEAPVVSVVMAAYRTEQSFFEEAVLSILGQTFEDFEFIVVDDGLSEENRAWLASIVDVRLRVLVNERNMGQSRSVNRALGVARGRYVIRMDADDVAVPTRIERQVAFMEENPQLIAGGGQVRFLGTDKVRPRPMDGAELRATLALKDPLVHPTMVLRLDALKNAGVRYDEEQLYAQDYMLWVDLVAAGDIALQPEVVLEYRVHGGQITSRKSDAQRACADAARLKYLRACGADATLRHSQLLGEIANGPLRSSSAEYDGACRVLERAAAGEGSPLNAGMVKRLVASHVLRTTLYGLRSSDGAKRLLWGRFWRALLCVPYWSFYVKSKA